ncbi:MAG: zinc ABC transporter substrate-binding protein [Treponema sp.]|nr:zinc ABC transporter substrate-binding protein [Candidatus Treponema equi]
MKNTVNRKNIVFILASLVFILVSCKGKAGKVVPGETENRNTIKITATFYPLYVLLQNITDGIDGIQLSVLAPADTGCLHDYQLTTGDMKKIEKCDILVANGSGMEDFIEKIVDTKKESLIFATEGFTLVDDNSHVWVSPTGAIHETKMIAEGLARLDPSHADQYKKNGEAYIEKLTTLKAQMHEILDPYAGKKIVTFHEAFPYFAHEFDLKIESVIEREPGEAPSPKELAEQIKNINSILSDGTKIALFAEPQYSSSAAEIIAKETGLTVFELDPCVTGDYSSAGIKDSYINAMKHNADVLKEALEH